jgi:hypothetical protein
MKAAISCLYRGMLSKRENKQVRRENERKQKIVWSAFHLSRYLQVGGIRRKEVDKVTQQFVCVIGFANKR